MELDSELFLKCSQNFQEIFTSFEKLLKKAKKNYSNIL
jgi:hypothetical protein